METFTKLFGSLLVFVYHCFDRIVIHGYLSGLSLPDQVVYFFRDVVSKELPSKRPGDYQLWVEAYAGNHAIPVEWTEKGARSHPPRSNRRPADYEERSRAPTAPFAPPECVCFQ